MIDFSNRNNVMLGIEDNVTMSVTFDSARILQVISKSKVDLCFIIDTE